jgi:hypothetical protein
MKKTRALRTPRSRSIGSTLLITFLSGVVYKGGEALFERVLEPKLNEFLAPTAD